MRARIRTTLVVAASLLVLLEVGLRAFGDRLGEPQFWYAPDAQRLVEEMDRLVEADQQTDTILAGSSMVQWGLIPDILEDELSSVHDARNAGIPKGYTTVTRRWLLEEVAFRMNPVRVVWGLSSIDFNGGRPTPALEQYEEARAGSRGFFGSVDRGMWSVSMISRYREILREPSFVRDLFEPVPEEEVAGLGDLMAPRDWPVLAQTDNAFAALRNSLLADFHIGPGHAEAFSATVEALRDRDIDVVIVLLPVSEPYIDAHPGGSAGYEEFVAWIGEEAERLEVPLFDYGRLIPEEGFLDYNHIGPAYAEILTEALAADLAGSGW